MLMDTLWWKGGRLIGTLDAKHVSFSITEAWPLTIKDERIAEACYDVLRPYSLHRMYQINVLLNKERKRENGTTA